VIQVARGISSVQVPGPKPDSPRTEGNRIAENSKLEPTHANFHQGLRGSVWKTPNERHAHQYASNEHSRKINAISALKQMNAQYGKRQRQIIDG
jgi:hypothetical protein